MEKSIYSGKAKELRRLLVEARKKSGLTQTELSKRLKKVQSFVSHYENGLRRIDVIEYIEICRILDADPVRILRKITTT